MRAVRAFSLLLAALHVFPARKHLVALVEAPSWWEAWKGLGALVALAFLLAPPTWQARAVRWIVAQRGVLVAICGALVFAHGVAVVDHLPAFLQSWTWSDGWRGVGGTFAALLFALPHLWRRVLPRVRPLTALRAPRLAVAMAGGAIVFAACGGSKVTPDGGGADGGVTPAPCTPCVGDGDCGGGVCAQVAGDSYCAPQCPNGNECASDQSCVAATTVGGQAVTVCVPTSSGVCAVGDAGTPTNTCGGLVGPTIKAACPCTGTKCQANGCYGGWWCNTQTNKCQAPPMNCGGGDAGVPLPVVGPVTGSVGPTGGTVSRLYFGVVGDTRPPLLDDTKAYPSAIIQKIYGDLQALSPVPPFVVSTGDYNFSSTMGSAADLQMGLYASARATYSGVLFPAMGNHECTGATASNCGQGNPDGITANYTAFMSKLLGPIQKADPYYSVEVDDANGMWTAKFVFIAANAWSAAQASWLQTTLATPTTYTFIVRHEPWSANNAPGVTPSEQIMKQYPYTLSIVGHTHSYEHTGRQVLIGNGGAPLSGYKNYGFGLLQQRVDGAIEVDVVDYQTGLADGTFRFAVKPDGSPAP